MQGEIYREMQCLGGFIKNMEANLSKYRFFLIKYNIYNIELSKISIMLRKVSIKIMAVRNITKLNCDLKYTTTIEVLSGLFKNSIDNFDKYR